MNRREELEAMIEELNQPAPGLETTLDRAYKKKRKIIHIQLPPPKPPLPPFIKASNVEGSIEPLAESNT